MATATKAKKGFSIPCPHCGDLETGLKVWVGTLTIECGSCGEEVTRSDLQEMIDDARRLMAWLDKASEV